LDHELGIKAAQVPVDEFKFLTRIHYLSPSGEGLWGEHESHKICQLKLTDSGLYSNHYCGRGFGCQS
jgi:isopentenyldiphosphate isomerase